MDKQKRLTIKYFVQQKIKEVSKFLFWVILIISITYALGYLISCFYNLKETGLNLISVRFLLGFLSCMLLSLFGVIFYNIYLILREWIDDNWELAKARAKEDLKWKKK